MNQDGQEPTASEVAINRDKFFAVKQALCTLGFSNLVRCYHVLNDHYIFFQHDVIHNIMAILWRLFKIFSHFDSTYFPNQFKAPNAWESLASTQTLLLLSIPYLCGIELGRGRHTPVYQLKVIWQWPARLKGNTGIQLSIWPMQPHGKSRKS